MLALKIITAGRRLLGLRAKIYEPFLFGFVSCSAGIVFLGLVALETDTIGTGISSLFGVKALCSTESP